MACGSRYKRRSLPSSCLRVGSHADQHLACGHTLAAPVSASVTEIWLRVLCPTPRVPELCWVTVLSSFVMVAPRHFSMCSPPAPVNTIQGLCRRTSCDPREMGWRTVDSQVGLDGGGVRRRSNLSIWVFRRLHLSLSVTTCIRISSEAGCAENLSGDQELNSRGENKDYPVFSPPQMMEACFPP